MKALEVALKLLRAWSWIHFSSWNTTHHHFSENLLRERDYVGQEKNTEGFKVGVFGEQDILEVCLTVPIVKIDEVEYFGCSVTGYCRKRDFWSLVVLVYRLKKDRGDL